MFKPAVHVPVLLQESLSGLNIQPQETYVDLTFGGGGHTRAILAQLTAGGRLFAFDQDQEAAQRASQVQNQAFTFIRANAKFIKQFLAYHGVSKVAGMLVDLGVSSYQLDTAMRGFSTRLAGGLDMRMDQKNRLTAHEIVNTYSLDQLTHLLRNYGEVRAAHAMAKAIITTRVHRPIHTTEELKTTLGRFVPIGRSASFFAQVFQAFRIAVNDELGALQAILDQSATLLKKGGRLVVISYHSLEDRLVKRFIHTGNFTGEVPKDVYGNTTYLPPMRPVYKKPTRPSPQEIQANPRARSAKLRIGERW